MKPLECFRELSAYLNDKAPSSKVAVFTDTNVADLYQKAAANALLQAEIEHTFIPFGLGEVSKNLKTVDEAYKALFDFSFKKGDVLVAFGGGVVLDIAGFIAATYMRGVRLIYIPSTLLAMVDASIGGKNGVNAPYGKNLIGSIYPSEETIIDLDLLDTLQEREFCAGFAEILKHSLIADQKLFIQIESLLQVEAASLKELFLKFPQRASLVERNCRIKEEVCFEDAQNPSLSMRDQLNFGHTLGHALEVQTDYRLSHGEAVLIGISYEAHISRKRGLLGQEDLLRIGRLIRTIYPAYDLEVERLQKEYQDVETLDRLIELMQNDKKSLSEDVPLILLGSIGRVHAPNPESVCVRLSSEECKGHLLSFFKRQGACI